MLSGRVGPRRNSRPFRSELEVINENLLVSAPDHPGSNSARGVQRSDSQTLSVHGQGSRRDIHSNFKCSISFNTYSTDQDDFERGKDLL